MLTRLLPRTTFGRVAVVLLWILAGIAGIATTARYVDVCEQSKQGQQKDCFRQHVGPYLLTKAEKTLSNLEPIFVGIGTLIIAAFTWRLWAATSGLWHHARAVERAYVKISHLPPGVSFNENGRAVVTIQVINRGHTPAYVTDVRLSPIVMSKEEMLAVRPRYQPPSGPPAQAFLTASDHIFLTLEFVRDDWAAVRAGAKKLYFVGYVDYIDAFKVRHRGGYARVYARHERTNNLAFVTNSAYNYDTLRPEGVGLDWGDHNA
jgi:hypothetical protein